MAGPALPERLEILRRRAPEAALFLDYDGTLAPIVADPALAVPVDGIPELLSSLARRFALVAVVSGRPATFLADTLGAGRGFILAGLYGMELVEPGGGIAVPAEAEPWPPVVAGLVEEARAEAPPGLGVEDKGLTVTLHWRLAPETEGWASAFARSAAARTGLRAQPGRMSVELRPPIEADKGSVVRRFGSGHRAVGCFGDDLGDLPAFRALDELERDGAVVVRVAVVDPESPPEVAAAADVLVDGPEGARALLERLLG